MDKRLNINKTVITLITLNIVQLGALTGVIVYSAVTPYDIYTARKPGSVYMFILILVITALLNSFITIRDRYILLKAAEQQRFIAEALKKVENLNNVLRAQRHDFLNHLQVVYSLMEMDEYNDARDYIDRVYNDIQKVSKILKTANPAINALLQAKILDGEKRGITTALKVTSQLNDIKIPSWEMCRVLGNLIDNAIDAFEGSEGDKAIEIDLYEDLKNYGFKVVDNGPAIPENQLDRIFDAGFTTKGEKGEGMGLAIAKDILTKYGGSIKAYRVDKTTVFEGCIPK